MNIENNKLNIWWKLAIVSLIINILTIPIWALLRWGEILFPHKDRIPSYAHYGLVVTCWLLAVPLVYFAVFCVWHWRTRYAGKNHLAWPVLVVTTYWPNIITTLPGSFFVAIVYFFMHILPDIRGKGVYANPPDLVITPPATPLPAKFQLMKSACFTIGWGIIIISLLASTTALIANFTIWNIVAKRIPSLVGHTFTEKNAMAYIGLIDITKICVITNYFFAITAVVGGIVIYISQRLRWRLLEEEEKEEIRTSFNKENSEQSNSQDSVPLPEI